MTSDVSRAIQCGSLPRSGSSATETAPASGTSRINVRIESFISRRSPIPT